MSNLDKERKSWFEIFRSWLVFNLEWRSNKINSVVDGALFFSRRFLDHISFHLKTTSFREPNKARNCLDVINSEYKISPSSLQLKRKQASLLTDTHFSILKFTLRFVTLITSRSSHMFRYTRVITSRLIETIERFSIAFTANGKRQTEISRLPKSREIYLVSAYILPVSHSYAVSNKNSEIS